MLWNWYTIDSCFIASSWHVRSRGAFAGSCIGVIFLVISLEFLRRAQREFDRYLARRRRAAAPAAAFGKTGSESTEEGGSDHAGKFGVNAVTVRRFYGGVEGKMQPKIWEQAVRSLLYMMQFTVGYFVMLLAMYYNGKLPATTRPFWSAKVKLF